MTLRQPQALCCGSAPSAPCSAKGDCRMTDVYDFTAATIDGGEQSLGPEEPGRQAEIPSFCSLTYDVKFPMFAKVEVNGPGTHPLFAYLKKAAKGVLGSTGIKWNFTKFLVDRSGRVVARFAPTVTP